MLYWVVDKQLERMNKRGKWDRERVKKSEKEWGVVTLECIINLQLGGSQIKYLKY